MCARHSCAALTDRPAGRKLSHENIRFQLVTFLIAGHETTSGMLSFLFHYLLITPHAYQAIRREVDEVIGGASVNLEHLAKLKYIDASLKEALRLQPTAPAWTVAPLADTTICDGKYAVPKDQGIGILLHALHRDPAVWGDDVEDFRPERMLDGKFEALPPDSWKPFGNGVRACIGRPFAWQEALLAVAMVSRCSCTHRSSSVDPVGVTDLQGLRHASSRCQLQAIGMSLYEGDKLALQPHAVIIVPLPHSSSQP